MKRTINWAAALLLAVLACAGCGKKKEAKVLTPGAPDYGTTVIWVDAAGISYGEIMADVERLSRGIPPDLPPEKLQEIRTRILFKAMDDLVRRQLILGEYQRSGIAIPQDEVDKARSTMFRTAEELAARLADSHMTVAQLDDNIRLDIFRNRMVKDELDKETATLDEETARKYYDENIAMFTKPAGRMASHILVRVAKDASDEDRAAARKKAETVRRAAMEEGADFVALVRDVSDAPDRVLGGQLGIVTPGRLIPEIEGPVYSQEVGAIGDIVEAPDGFHIIKVTSIEEEEVLPFDTVKNQILQRLRLQIQQRLGAEFVAKLRDRATIRFDGPFAELNQQPAQKDADADAASIAETASETEAPAAE